MAATPGDEVANGHNDVDPLSDPEERRVLYAALDSFRQYRRAAHFNITHLRRQAFYSLPTAHMELLSEAPFSLPKTFDAVDEAIDSNADIAESILKFGLPAFGIDPDNEDWKGCATPDDMDKARSTIRQLYRDWSLDGFTERHASYSPIVSALDSYLPSTPSQRHRYRILVPGAGLGRLVFDICMFGFTVEGNEISYHQLLASNYILNFTQTAEQHNLYPWALSFSNHRTRANQLQSVKIPDLQAGTSLAEASELLSCELPPSERMSMSAGDFCDIYQKPEYESHFDAVTTCFFIDTAPNVINYINTVKNCLKTGGVWINLGPLLWHFEAAPTPAEREQNHAANGEASTSSGSRPNAGIGEPGSFELSDTEVVALLQKLGFDVLKHTDVPAGEAGYIQDPYSMLQSRYKPSFWVAKKR